MPLSTDRRSNPHPIVRATNVRCQCRTVISKSPRHAPSVTSVLRRACIHSLVRPAVDCLRRFVHCRSAAASLARASPDMRLLAAAPCFAAVFHITFTTPDRKHSLPCPLAACARLPGNAVHSSRRHLVASLEFQTNRFDTASHRCDNCATFCRNAQAVRKKVLRRVERPGVCKRIGRRCA